MGCMILRIQFFEFASMCVHSRFKYIQHRGFNFRFRI
jgi:hypothetical protein